jgi:hypothetical protein
VITDIEVTWFGFDVAATDLPAWAATAAGDDRTEAESAAAWVRANVGTDSTISMGGVALRAGGGRGAYTLHLSGQAVPTDASSKCGWPV